MGIKGRKWFRKSNVTESGDKVIELSEKILSDALKSVMDFEQLVNMSDDEKCLIKNTYELLEASKQYTKEVNKCLSKIDEIDYKLNQVLERMTKS